MNHAIRDISTYIKKIKSLHTTETPFHLSHIYYRGQSDKTWCIIPSIFRDRFLGKEFDILNEALYKAHLYLKEYSSYLEKLIMLQHFGLPTRLLDITKNPLVALYFACNENFKKDGVVYYGYQNFYQPAVAELIADIVFEKNLDIIPEDYLYFLSQKYSQRIGFQISPEALENFLITPQCIYTPQNNPRIIAQSGAFIVTPLVKREDLLFSSKPEYSFDIGEGKVFDGSIEIKANHKEAIINELSEIGINEASLFPDIEHLMNNIKKRHSNKKQEVDI